MIGGGKRFEDLVRSVKDRRLEGSFSFQPYQAESVLPFSLSVPDVHWLSLNPQLEGLIVPSKFYGIAAAGRPIIMIGNEQGEIGRLIRQYGCGITITPGDVTTLAATLQQWSERPQFFAEMGLRARQMLEARFTRRQALDRWSRLVEELTS